MDDWGFPGGTSGKEPTCQCRRHKIHRFDPWVWKIPWRRAWQPTPAFLPRESYEQRSLACYHPQGCKELDETETTGQACMYSMLSRLFIILNASFWRHYSLLLILKCMPSLAEYSIMYLRMYVVSKFMRLRVNTILQF